MWVWQTLFHPKKWKKRFDLPVSSKEIKKNPDRVSKWSWLLHYQQHCGKYVICISKIISSLPSTYWILQSFIYFILFYFKTLTFPPRFIHFSKWDGFVGKMRLKKSVVAWQPDSLCQKIRSLHFIYLGNHRSLGAGLLDLVTKFAQLSFFQLTSYIDPLHDMSTTSCPLITSDEVVVFSPMSICLFIGRSVSWLIGWFVCLICLSAGLRENFSTSFNGIQWKGGTWAEKEPIKLCGRSRIFFFKIAR